MCHCCGEGGLSWLEATHAKFIAETRLNLKRDTEIISANLKNFINQNTCFANKLVSDIEKERTFWYFVAPAKKESWTDHSRHAARADCMYIFLPSGHSQSRRRHPNSQKAEHFAKNRHTIRGKNDKIKLKGGRSASSYSDPLSSAGLSSVVASQFVCKIMHISLPLLLHTVKHHAVQTE